jgi:hypothetical protein
MLDGDRKAPVLISAARYHTGSWVQDIVGALEELEDDDCRIEIGIDICWAKKSAGR